MGRVILSFLVCNDLAEGGIVVFMSLWVCIYFTEGVKRGFVLSGFAIISLKEEELFCPFWFCNYFAEGRVVLSFLVLQLLR